MKIGKTIKHLRRERDMTQERYKAIADHPRFVALVEKLRP